MNKKICLIGNYNNYSYQHRRDKVVDRKISEFTLKEEYYKDGILKEVWTSFSEKELQTTVVWTDCNKKEKYIFDQNNKTVRKANYFEEDFTKTIARISKNGMITENNMINLLMAVLWPFSYRVESEGESYVLKYNINDKNINTDVEEYIYKSNGFPRAVYQYGNDGIRLCENYYDIKLNETTDENVKMPDLNEYSMIYE